MSYVYEVEKPYVFTDEGQRAFLKVRDTAFRLDREAGAFTVEKAIAGLVGSSWSMLACVDRLVEIGEFEYVNPDNVATQYKIMRRRR